MNSLISAVLRLWTVLGWGREKGFQFYVGFGKSARKRAVLIPNQFPTKAG